MRSSQSVNTFHYTVMARPGSVDRCVCGDSIGTSISSVELVGLLETGAAVKADDTPHGDS